MYTSFYNLHSKPFQISSDPAFMWFGEKHKEALATLKYGILDNKGFLLLTGDVGTGKTSLINSLLQSLGDDIICTSVPDPSLEKMDFLNYIASAFDMNREFSTKGSFLAHFRHFLLEAYDAGKKVLLIIDESQLLTQEMLEEIRLLSNIERTDAKLINIFFVGQNEFNEILNQQQNRAVRQRLTLNYNLDPLTPDETDEYIKHRLKVAGTTETIFDTSAVQEIFLYSGGFPRRINIICDHSLLSGYVKDKKEINALIVRECARELKIPAHVRNRDINGFSDFHSRPAPVPLPPVPALAPKKTKTFFKWTMALILLIIFSWFFIFPNHFKSYVSIASDRILILKTQIVPLLPNSLAHYFSPQSPNPAQTSETPTHPPLGKNHENPASTPGEKIVSKPILFEPTKTDPLDSSSKKIIIPNIEPDIKSDIEPDIESDSKPVIEPDSKLAQKVDKILFQPEKSVDMKADPTITNPLKPETQKNEITSKKEILPLPQDKVIVRVKYNTNDFTEAGFKNLNTFADILVMHPESNILITGYTDSQGNPKYNRKLSGFRANMVKSFLLGKGVKPDQIKIQGSGSENPIESNDTSWGRMMNRRVEIEILQ